jgi:hypothetical protein
MPVLAACDLKADDALQVQTMPTGLPYVDSLLNVVRVHYLDQRESLSADTLAPSLVIRGSGDPENEGPWLAKPMAVDWHEGMFYVADEGRQAIIVFAGDGSLARVFHSPGQAPNDIGRPTDVLAASEHVFVLDQQNQRVSVLDRNLVPVETIPASHLRVNPLQRGTMWTLSGRLHIPRPARNDARYSVYSDSYPFSFQGHIIPGSGSSEHGTNNLLVTPTESGYCVNYNGTSVILCFREDHDPAFAYYVHLRPPIREPTPGQVISRIHAIDSCQNGLWLALGSRLILIDTESHEVVAHYILQDAQELGGVMMRDCFLFYIPNARPDIYVYSLTDAHP